MTGLFKAKNPSGNILLFFYAVAVKFPLLFVPAGVAVLPGDGIAYRYPMSLLLKYFSAGGYFWSIIVIVLHYVQALMLNRAVTNHRLHQQPNYLTAMSYLLVSSLLPQFMQMSSLLIVNFLLIILWDGLSKLDNSKTPRSVLFNLGLATGIAAFFYFPALLFVLLLVIGTAIMRPFKSQEWLVALAGAITPAYFYGAYLFLTDSLNEYSLPAFFPAIPFFGKDPIVFARAGFIILLFSAGIYFVNGYINRQIVHARKVWQMLFLFIAAAIALLFSNGNVYALQPVCIGMAPVAAAAFLYPKRRLWPDLLHLAGLALIIWNYTAT